MDTSENFMSLLESNLRISIKIKFKIKNKQKQGLKYELI